MIKYSFLILGLLFAINSHSQSIKSYVISSTGAAMMSEDGALYISIGEPMNTEISKGEVMISQGFLNVSIASSVSTDDKILQEPIMAYPNPSSAEITLEIPEWSGDYSYQLFDLNSKLMKTTKVLGSKTQIDLTELISGTYFMKVIKDDSSSKLVKIVKL